MSRKLPPAPRSSIKGVEWPALSFPNGRTILSLLHQFEQSEWWSGDDIHLRQFRQLGRLLAHACENVPYYRERLKESGVKDPESVTPEEWSKLPFLRRSDIQRAGKELHSETIPRGHGKVGDIHTSGTHLLEIINDILDLSKIEAGKLELEIDRVSVTETFGQCLRLVNERAVYAGIMIRVEEPADTSICIETDQRRLKQIFINLLSNAIKFTHQEGEIILGCRVTDAGGCDMYVADTGIGMSEAEIEKALTPFGQVDSSLARKEEGAGLGLPLVVAFVEMMGGTLDVTSEKGAGTSVTIHVPPEFTIVE